MPDFSQISVEQYDLTIKRIQIQENRAYEFIVAYFKELNNRRGLEELELIERNKREQNLKLKLEENKGPKWKESELNELGYSLRSYIESKIEVTNYIRERLDMTRIKKPLVKRMCIECNKEFKTNRDKQVFCSSKCRFDNWDKLHPRTTTPK
jgi:hypothetical protein